MYFNLLNIPIPNSAKKIAHFLEEDEIVVKQDDGLYAITNLGAILLAEKISDFS